MVLSGMVAPPRGYWIKSSMTGLGRLTWMFMDRHGLPCRYCLKASMTAARSIHPVNRRVSNHGVSACALARRILTSAGNDTVLHRSLLENQVRNDGE